MHNHPDSFGEIHLNLKVRGLGVSATVAINDRSDELIRRGRDVIKLGLGQSPFPVPELVVEALRENAHQKAYLPVKGLYELRKAVAEHHRRTFGIDCTAEEVLIGPGSKELMFLLQLAYYGDLVISTPSWVSYAPQAQIIGRNIFVLPTSIQSNWQLTAAQLEEFCAKDHGRPRILVLNYPSNPTGRTLSHAQLADIAEVARENHVVVLSDEIYAKIHHTGQHESIVPLYPESTIFSGGLSKWCGAGGWRLGLFVFPKSLRWLLDAMAAVASETFTSTSAPIQYAAIRAFQGGAEIDRYIARSRRVLSALGNHLTRLLEKTGADILPPEGAFYLFPDFSPLRDKLRRKGINTSVEMCEKLLDDTGVAILPGSAFSRPADELTARLAYVDFDGAAALEAAGTVPEGEALGDDFVRTHCGRVVEGVDRIGDWLGSME